MLHDSPVAQFEQWLEQTVASGLIDPTAMVLATVDKAGLLWQRIVLLKGLSSGGFVFYTNYESDKAGAIEAQPQVSLHFPWNALDRQVIVRGTAQKVVREESIAYFATRPRESQIAAWASRQSKSISVRSALEQQAQLIEDKFGEGEIPTPDFWGGYSVIPEVIEFWQGGEHRLHDRFRYTRRDDNTWEVDQLQP
jgi:pyridoxamine 5'-phosphate oxidase